MARFGFIYTPSDNWVGGKNYYISLFSQLNIELEKEENEVVIFTGSTFKGGELESFDNLIVKKSPILNQQGVINIFYKLVNKIIGENCLLYFLLKKYKIDVLSHAYIPQWTKIKCLPWIPDFQHCLLPEYFSERHIKLRNINYQKYLNNRDFLLSSYSALEDAQSFFQIKGKSHVYRFKPRVFNEFNEDGYQKLSEKHGIGQRRFVFLPNQFWKHKNHLLCFKACLKAIDKGSPFLLICSGGFSDDRNPEYNNEIRLFIENNSLSEYIKLVGLIDRGIFNCLMKYSEVVVNPSKFEGWSTTVEETKLMKKPLALSNLNVHREQTDCKSDVEYFDVDNVDQCLEAIQTLLNRRVINNEDSNVVKEEKSFYQILKSIVNN